MFVLFGGGRTVVSETGVVVVGFWVVTGGFVVDVSHRPLLISMLSRAISLLYPVPISPRNINCTNLVLVFASKSNFARCH